MVLVFINKIYYFILNYSTIINNRILKIIIKVSLKDNNQVNLDFIKNLKNEIINKQFYYI